MILDFHIEKALEIDPREEKLPAWVRDKLSLMRRATNETLALHHAFMTGSEPGPFWFQPWSGPDSKRFYLPTKAGRLMYGNPTKSDEEFTLSDGCGNQWGQANLLTIVGREGLAVLPNCSNVIQIKGTTE